MSTRKRSELVQAMVQEVRRFLASGILFNEKVAAELGLNGTDLQLLNLLELQGSATPGDLARWSSLTTGGVTVAVDRLEKAGFVKREPNPKDRRSNIIRPVPKRLLDLYLIYKSKGELVVNALSGFNDRELQTIMNFLKRANGGSD
ncbi:MAG TPA: MarR family winged helix-turn-helix transcriptional regulator [Bryobacteraceae bacterium]|nr:MarR family winged helix-turn-helix transcriptional regulator [Bryobacteraceae bacterium]